jgi:hypothetical protein
MGVRSVTSGDETQACCKIASQKIDLDTPTPLNILHRLIYNLVYPAILGTYLYAVLFPTSKIPGEIVCWMLAIVIYLAAQYTLGTFRNRNYTPASFTVDVMEIALMAFVLSAMSKMDSLSAPSTHIRYAILALLLIPVLYRGMRFLKGSLNLDRWGFHVSLTMLSVVAACAAFVGFPEGASLIIFAICIAIYLVAFVIWNTTLFRSHTAFLRPTVDSGD